MQTSATGKSRISATVVRHDAARAGFSLMELLVVVSIIGLAWFAILPNLDIVGQSRDDAVVGFADFIDQVRAKALNTHSLERVQVVVGKEELRWGEETFMLNAPVQSCEINNQLPPRLDFFFHVYPSGAMDQLELTLHSGEIIKTTPLGVVTIGD